MAVFISERLEVIIGLMFFVFGLASIGFGVYEFINGEVTKAVLAFILGVFVLQWIEAGTKD